jgi:D-galactarolactone cycloisomerase
MTIERVETRVLSHPLGQPRGSGRRFSSRRAAVLVKVTAAGGAVGWGECAGAPEAVAPLLREFLAPRAVAADPLAAGALNDDLAQRCAEQGGGPLYHALAGLDLALWDLRARLLGVSLATLLGGRRTAVAQAYCAALPYARGADAPEQAAAAARAAAEAGWTAVVLKVGADRERDLASLRAVRRAVGPDLPIALDADGVLTASEALALALPAADEGLAWFEEPVAPDDEAGLAIVRAALAPLGVPLAAGRLESDPARLARRLASGGPDWVTVDPTVVGLSGALFLASAAAAHHRRVRPVGGVSAVGVAAVLAWLATRPERPAPVAWEWGECPLRDDLAPVFPHREGPAVAIPDGPGLGFELDEERLDCYL